MNNPKLTNILLIALIVINGLLLLGWHMQSHRRHHHQFSYERFHGEHGGRSWAFHRGGHGFMHHGRHMMNGGHDYENGQNN
ncbi:MAG TPA: hypothetical protein VK806_09515 [Bacteroidia bacterium]|jgi:hypothetical protein|nr:hypothetical protein [Bacteroidia bacterium]